MNYRLVTFVVLLMLMLLFVFQNTESVQIRFLFWQIEASRVLIYLCIFLIGVGSGWSANALKRWYRNKR